MVMDRVGRGFDLSVVRLVSGRSLPQRTPARGDNFECGNIHFLPAHGFLKAGSVSPISSLFLSLNHGLKLRLAWHDQPLCNRFYARFMVVPSRRLLKQAAGYLMCRRLLFRLQYLFARCS